MRDTVLVFPDLNASHSLRRKTRYEHVVQDFGILRETTLSSCGCVEEGSLPLADLNPSSMTKVFHHVDASIGLRVGRIRWHQ